MAYDHAQSPRLGQPTSIETTTVRMFTGVDLPEVAWDGQVIYRSDTNILQVYSAEDDAWNDVAGGTGGLLTFVGSEIPVSQSAGDLWFQTNEEGKRALYRAAIAGADAIAAGEWELTIAEVTEIPVDNLLPGDLNTGGGPITFGSPLILDTDMQIIGKMEVTGVGSVGLSGAEGFYVKGPIPEGGTEANRPRLVVFPVDGDPNIFAGQITALTALFTEGALFRGESGIEFGAKLVLHGEIRAPKNLPVISTIWDRMWMSLSVSISSNVTNRVVTFDGTYYTEFIETTISGDKSVWVQQWNLDGTPAVAGMTEIPGGNVIAGNEWFMMSAVYHPGRSKYYVLWRRGGEYRIRIYNSDLTLAETNVILLSAVSSSGLALGVDHHNNDLLIAFDDSEYTNIAGWSTSVGTGVVAMNPAYVSEIAFTEGRNHKRVTYVSAGYYDFSSIKYFALHHENSDSQIRFHGYNTTSSNTLSSSKTFPSANGDPVISAWWTGSQFQSVHLDSKSQILVVSDYEGGEMKEAGYLEMKWHVAYSWYDSVGTTHESALSPTQTWDMVPRCKVLVSVDPIPGLALPEGPDSARVYLHKATDVVTPTAAQWKLRGTFTGDLLTDVIAPKADGAAYTLKAADFPAGSPGEIQSSDNGSYWKGDNTAKFLQLLLSSTTDAGTGAGNLPPLRTGDPAGKHIRYGTEEIISMNDDDSVGTLYLNRGGVTAVARGSNGRFQVGPAGRELQIIDSGSGGQTPDGAGVITVNHSLALGTLTYQVNITPRSNGVPRFVTITEKNANNFKFRVENLSGNAVTTGTFGYDWMIIG